MRVTVRCVVVLLHLTGTVFWKIWCVHHYSVFYLFLFYHESRILNMCLVSWKDIIRSHFCSNKLFFDGFKKFLILYYWNVCVDQLILTFLNSLCTCYTEARRFRDLYIILRSVFSLWVKGDKETPTYALSIAVWDLLVHFIHI